MSRSIVKVADRYLIWSSVVDAPISCGLTLEELREWVREEYGAEGLRRLPLRLEAVETKGTSVTHHDSADDTMWLNRAGKKETRLTKAQIVDFYIRRGGEGDSPMGYVETYDEPESFWTVEMYLGGAAEGSESE